MAIPAAIRSGVRRELDFYPTPPEATHALLPLIPLVSSNSGILAAVTALSAKFWSSLVTPFSLSDLVDRGFGRCRTSSKCKSLAFIDHHQSALLLRPRIYSARPQDRCGENWCFC